MIAAAALGAACQVQGGPPLQVLSETSRLRWTDDLPATSPYFDGATVRLAAARGETLGVEVARAPDAPVPVALVIAGAAVHGFAVDHVTVTARSTALYGASRGPGRYPDRLRPIDGAVPTPRLAYFDVEVPADAAPGLHRGELVVGDRRFPVELEVAPLVLPPLDAAPWVWAYYDAREIAAVAGTTGDDAATLDAERAYAALFRRYGVIASPELTLESLDARRPLVTGLRYWPVLLPRDRAGVTAAVAAWIARTRDSGAVPFAIPVDEPRTPEAQARVREVSGWVRAAGGGPGRFLYAVTHGPTPALGDAIDVYIAGAAVRDPSLPRERAWTYNGEPGWAGAMVVDARDRGTLRSWGWLGYAHAIPLWYVWDALYWHDRHHHRGDHDLLTAPITFDDGEDHGNLDGVLAYPGPLPSLRLAQLRRGLTDRLLLAAYAARAGRAAAQALAHDVTTRWPADEAGWAAAHRALLGDRIYPSNHRK